jgi:DDE superfamily endonuclease
VLLLSPTVEGSKHDYQAFKEWGLGAGLTDDVGMWMDTGFQGIRKDYPHLKVAIPKKKPRGGELTEAEKEDNRDISKDRVIVENSLAGVKRLNSVTDIYRNQKYKFDDRLMLVSCGIWNYHLEAA